MCYLEKLTPYTMKDTSYGIAGCELKESVDSKYTIPISIPFTKKLHDVENPKLLVVVLKTKYLSHYLFRCC